MHRLRPGGSKVQTSSSEEPFQRSTIINPTGAGSLGMYRGWLLNSSHMDLLLPLAGLGDVIRGLHPHECVHLHSKRFLNAQGHIARKVSLAVEQAG
jgi:hypothetical protein